MRTIEHAELQQILTKHRAWLRGDADGVCAVLREANLTGAVLTDAVLRDANLTGANLTNANLAGANLPGVPVVPQLHTQMLAALERGGTLDMRHWHSCTTTHCRAGWAIHLAGDAGAALEAALGPATAGALIHLASCPWLERVPNFYAPTKAALADIRACAAREAALAVTEAEAH